MGNRKSDTSLIFDNSIIVQPDFQFLDLATIHAVPLSIDSESLTWFFDTLVQCHLTNTAVMTSSTVRTIIEAKVSALPNSTSLRALVQYLPLDPARACHVHATALPVVQ